MVRVCVLVCFFFFNDTATTEIYTLSLHDALPIFHSTFRIPHSALKGNAPGTPQRRPTSLSAAPCEGLTRFTSGRPADLGRRKLACRLPVLYGRRTTPPRYGRGHPDCSNRRSTESTPAYS